MGNLNYSDFLDSYGLYEDNKISHEYYRNEDNARNLCGALRQIVIYFQSWVETIKISNRPNLIFKKLINPKCDLFLNFNYTNTLEKLYQAKNVCHIHGTQYDEIYFGHGNDIHNTDNIQRNWFGAENELNKLQDLLRKNTDLAYKNNKSFFETIKKVTKQEDFNIYEYGFSFSEVDKVYLESIFSSIHNKNVHFYLNEFNDENTRKAFSKTIVECGFKGIISSHKV